MGVPFWGLVIYAIIFISGYFTWAIIKNSKEDSKEE